MASVSGFKKMNWFPKQSAWREMEAVRVKRRQAMEDFTANSNALAARFQATANLQIQGVGEIAARSAQTRLQERANEMRAELEKQYASMSKLV